MNRRKAVAALSASPLAFAQSKDSGVRARFIGVWKLVSTESKDKKTGEVRYPYGRNPVGRITYDTAGRMSAQLMNPARRKVGGTPTTGTTAFVSGASCEDLRAMLIGFAAYFGTFDIDESTRTVTHHVQCNLIPSTVGTDFLRTYEFAGEDRLILTADYEQSTLRLVWQRDR